MFFIVIIQWGYHCPYACITSIIVQYESFTEIWKCQHWCSSQTLFQMIKNCLWLAGLFKLNILFNEVMYGISDRCKVFSEFTVLAYITHQLFNFSLGYCCWPLVGWIGGKAIWRDNMPQISYFFLTNYTLRWLELSPASQSRSKTNWRFSRYSLCTVSAILYSTV